MGCSPPPLLIISGMAFEARAAQGPHIRTLYGLQPEVLAAQIEQAIGQGASGLLSFGTAAGLDAVLAPGSIVIGRQILHSGERWEADAAWSARMLAQWPQAVHADMAGVDAPLVSAKDKARLHAACGAAAADMESHRVAALAQRYHVPFAALRVVLDAADMALPPAALAAAKPDGSVNALACASSLLAHPAQLPALLRLARAHRAAKSTLLRCGGSLGCGFFGVDVA